MLGNLAISACLAADFTVMVHRKQTIANSQVYGTDNGKQIPVKKVVGEGLSKYLYLKFSCSRDPQPELTLKDIINVDEYEGAPSNAASA